MWAFNFLFSRLECSGRPDGAVRTSRGSTAHAAQAPWGHREERWIESIMHISLSHVRAHRNFCIFCMYKLSYKLCTGLDNPTLYRNFTAGGGLDIRQCFDSGEWRIPLGVAATVSYLKLVRCNQNFLSTLTVKHCLNQHSWTLLSLLFQKLQPDVIKFTTPLTQLVLQTCGFLRKGVLSDVQFSTANV